MKSKQDILNAFREKYPLGGEIWVLERHQKEVCDWLLTTLTEFERETLKDVLWLIDCENDCAKTAGEDTKILSNLKGRIDGHFNLEKQKL